MAQLRRDYQKFADREAEVVAIGPEHAKEFEEFWRSHEMPFPGIPDPEHNIARLYGQKVNLLKLGRMPAMVIIDKEGKIRFRHYGNSMSDITTNKDVLAVLDDLVKEPA